MEGCRVIKRTVVVGPLREGVCEKGEEEYICVRQWFSKVAYLLSFVHSLVHIPSFLLHGAVHSFSPYIHSFILSFIHSGWHLSYVGAFLPNHSLHPGGACDAGDDGEDREAGGVKARSDDGSRDARDIPRA